MKDIIWKMLLFSTKEVLTEELEEAFISDLILQLK